MTCIVGIVDGPRVWMGADRLVSCDGHMEIRAESKVFARGPYLLAAAGDSCISTILRHAPRVPSAPARVTALDAFMAVRFGRWVRDALAESGYGIEREGARMMDGCVLVGVRGSLYAIDGYFAARPVGPWHALGSGRSVASGALWATDGAIGTTPKLRIEIALRAAERFCETVQGPFDVVTHEGQRA